VLTKKEENRSLVFKRKALRTIYVPKIVDAVYSCTIRKYNFELDRKFNSLNVIGVLKSNRLRYAGHMIRGAEDLGRNQGRLKSRWADAVNSHSRAFGARG
jgi:hypothetical protein